MTILQKLKALIALNRAVGQVQEANVKSGWKTTEFWMTVATNIITVVGALKGLISDHTAGIIIASANSVYAIARALTKANATAVAPAAPATPTTSA